MSSELWFMTQGHFYLKKVSRADDNIDKTREFTVVQDIATYREVFPVIW